MQLATEAFKRSGISQWAPALEAGRFSVKHLDNETWTYEQCRERLLKPITRKNK